MLWLLHEKLVEELQDWNPEEGFGVSCNKPHGQENENE
jgi:hypothetical protein